MSRLKSLQELLHKARKFPPKRIIVAGAANKEVMQAIKLACENHLVIPVLVGDKKEIEKLSASVNLDTHSFEIHHVTDPLQACHAATELIRQGRGDILMKGMVSTATFLKPILNNETGLTKNRLLSHFSLFETPYYHKLLGISDVAINIAPDFSEKIEILKNAVEVFKKLGTDLPKVAVIAAIETVNPKMEATIHAAMLTIMNKRNQITDCMIDGPLAMDNAISKHASESKGIHSEVAGDADLLLMPDLNSGNILYKSLNFLGGATSASIVTGASVPIVLTSRADSEKSKLMSVALASLTS